MVHAQLLYATFYVGHSVGNVWVTRGLARNLRNCVRGKVVRDSRGRTRKGLVCFRYHPRMDHVVRLFSRILTV
ncbi:hypothetical protein E2C01_063979 [Portunus trituberculatus]|uniref:Uncharacterized protein n=1 Tax=Portunus trituberculatus TaxID=210409 RepID=A0A5B7HM17_PORTR|nr:hypothetical protein [Portunus trituberculatus]